MAKTREIVCVHYISKGSCDLGKDAEFYWLCQRCQKYKPKQGMKPARSDNRRKKLDAARKKDLRYE